MLDLKSSFTSTSIKPFYVGAPAATVSRDGLLMATPVEEDIVITDLNNNEILHEIEGDGELITNMVLTPDGTKLAVLSQSQQLRIFSLLRADEVVEEKLFKMSSPVYISTADATSSLFAFGGSDGVVTVWDVAGGYVTHSLKGHGTTVCLLLFHGELGGSDWKLALGDTMGTVKVWDLVKRKCVATINEHNTAVRGVGFNVDGSRFMTAGRDQVVVIYNDRLKVVKTISVGHQVEAAGFMEGVDESSSVFYTAGSGNVMQVWDAQSGEKLCQTEEQLETNEELVITDVVEVETGYMMVLSDQTVVEVEREVVEREEEEEEREKLSLPIVRRIAGNHGTIADIKYIDVEGGSGNLVAMATNSPALRIVDLDRPLEVQLLEGHKDLLNGVDATSDGKWLATAGKDNEARLWRFNEDLAQFEEFSVFVGHAGAVTCVALPKTPFESIPPFILTGSSDLTIKKWKVSPGTVKVSEYTRRAHEKDINAIALAPNDEFFATASYDKLAKVWSLSLGETVGVLKGHKRGLWDVNFCQYDKLLATSSGDKSIKLWSLQDFTCTKTFEGHTNAVQRVRFMNKNQQLVSAGADGLIKVWDIKSNECLNTLDAHDNRIWAFDIKNDGDEFISADADGKLSLWHDNSDEVAAERELAATAKVEQEQKLSNYIHQQDWSNAFLLALTLDHPMRLYHVFRSSVALNEDPDSAVGLFKLEKTIATLDDTQILGLFKRTRDWNINLKLFEVAQKVISSLMGIFPTDRLVEIKGLTAVIDGIVAYSERHYSRIDGLVESSYMLDYAVEKMA